MSRHDRQTTDHPEIRHEHRPTSLGGREGEGSGSLLLFQPENTLLLVLSVQQNEQANYCDPRPQCFQEHDNGQCHGGEETDTSLHTGVRDELPKRIAGREVLQVSTALLGVNEFKYNLWRGSIWRLSKLAKSNFLKFLNQFFFYVNVQLFNHHSLHSLALLLLLLELPVPAILALAKLSAA